MSEFDEYIVHGKPGQKMKADAWLTAIGLHSVYNLHSVYKLKGSSYLLDTARNISQKIFLLIRSVNKICNQYGEEV